MFPSPAARCSSAPVQACVLLIVLLRLNQTVYVCMCVCAHVCVCRLCVHITRLIRPHEPHEPAAGMHIKVGKTLNLHSPNKCHPPPGTHVHGACLVVHEFPPSPHLSHLLLITHLSLPQQKLNLFYLKVWVWIYVGLNCGWGYRWGVGLNYIGFTGFELQLSFWSEFMHACVSKCASGCMYMHASQDVHRAACTCTCLKLCFMHAPQNVHRASCNARILLKKMSLSVMSPLLLFIEATSRPESWKPQVW
jgi:hypothetical protein